MSEFTRTERTQVQRLPKRGNYDRATVYKILDEALVCHVGFVANGQPFVIPTGFGRRDDILYLHGSAASRMLGELGEGIPVCVTITLLDGLVLARSAFHHSMNYRSVMILGTAHPVIAEARKARGAKHFHESRCARPVGRRAPTDAAGIEGHHGARFAARRSVRKNSYRAACR